MARIKSSLTKRHDGGVLVKYDPIERMDVLKKTFFNRPILLKGAIIRSINKNSNGYNKE